MGACNSTQRRKNKETPLQKPLKTLEIKDECLIKGSSKFEEIDPHILNVSKSICKIKIDNYLQKISASGFLLKFYIDQELFYCLMSNEHVITEDIINRNSIIYIYYEAETKSANIKLDKNERYMKTFKDIDLDITIVEILEKDGISKDYFLFPGPEIENNKLINRNIFIPQFPKGEDLKIARGKIKEIEQYIIAHSANTERGSSGSPIFFENSLNVIGIHKGCNEEETENYGEFIYPAINIVREHFRNIKNIGRFMNGKYVWNDGKYYIGQFRNNLPNGKGIKYY